MSFWDYFQAYEVYMSYPDIKMTFNDAEHAYLYIIMQNHDIIMSYH